MAVAASTTVERIRLRRTRDEASIARLRLAHLLSPLSLRPPAMPPSAILLVRSMEDPLPGQITRDFGPAARASSTWESAVQERLGDLYRTAACPLWDKVSGNAAAICFADYGEMLACLARDLSSGAAGAWWWQSILRRISLRLPGSWATVWAEYPLYIPAALEYLEARQEAVTVLSRIAPVQAWNLLAVVLRAFNLSNLAAHRSPTDWLQQRLSRPATIRTDRGGERAATDSPRNAERDSAAPPEPALPRLPWEPHIPASYTPKELGYQRCALLGVGLLLRRARHVAFNPGFAFRFLAWIAAERARPAETQAEVPMDAPRASILDIKTDGSHLPRHTPTNAVSAGLSRLGSFRDNLLASGRDAKEAHPGVSSRAVRASEKLSRTDLSAKLRRIDGQYTSEGNPPSLEEELPLTAKDNSSLPDLRPAASSSSQLHDRNGEQVQLHSQWIRDVSGEPTPSTPPHMREAGGFTHLGGILYLVHLLRKADLLRHFDTGLSGWEMLELLARCLLDKPASQTSRELSEDPIWTALARLDGREPDIPPGMMFRPQRKYEAPDSWITSATRTKNDEDHQNGEHRRFVRFRSRGFEVWSEQGFVLLDSSDHLDKLAAAAFLPLCPLPRSGRQTFGRLAWVRPIGLSLSSELRRFLHFLLPYARWRLNRALGRTPLQEVLLRSGTLYVSATHVDLVMPMNQISVAARLAGLDANPGWVPELGRVITFHFEPEGH